MKSKIGCGILLFLLTVTARPVFAHESHEDDPAWLHVGLRAVLLPAGRYVETGPDGTMKGETLPFDFAPSAFFDATLLEQHVSLGVGFDVLVRSTIINAYGRVRVHFPLGWVEPYFLLTPGYSQIVHGGKDSRGFHLGMAFGMGFGRGFARPFFEMGYTWGFQQRELGSETSPPIYTQQNNVDHVMIVLGLQLSFGGSPSSQRQKPLSPDKETELDRRQKRLRDHLQKPGEPPKRDEPPSASQPAPASRPTEAP